MARRSAEVPFVQAANAIFTAEAAAVSVETTRVSTIVSANRSTMSGASSPDK
jgi:hypothetical protein